VDAFEAVYEFGVFENQEGGDGVDAKCAGRGGVLVGVELGDEVAACGFGRELIEHGGDGAAGAAPWGPAIDEDGDRGGFEGLLKGGIGDGKGVRGVESGGGDGKGCVALATEGLFLLGFGEVYSVFCVAVGAGDDHSKILMRIVLRRKPQRKF